MQALPEKKWMYGLLCIALSSGAFSHYKGIEISNANINLLVSIPIFFDRCIFFNLLN